MFVKPLTNHADLHAKHVDEGASKLVEENWTQDQLLRARSPARKSEAQPEKGAGTRDPRRISFLN